MACTVIYRPAASFSFLYLFFAATKFCSWCCPHPFHLLLARWLFYGLCCASFVNLVSLFTAPSPCTVMQTAALLSRSLRFKVRVRLAPFSSASKGCHGQWFLPRRSTDRPRPSLYPIFFHFPLVENSDCWKSVATECRKSLCLIAASKLMTATVYLYLCLSVLYYTEKIYWHLKNVLQIIIKQKSISLMYIYCILRWIKFLLSHCILYSWKKHFFPPSIYKRGRRSLPYYVTAPWHLNFLSAWVSVGWQLPQVRSLSPVCSPDITVMQSTPHFAIFPHEERLSQFNCTWI